MYNAYIQPSHSCKGFRSKTLKAMPCSGAHYCPSSETQGQIKGARESLNGRKNIYGTKKSKERREGALLAVLYFSSCHPARLDFPSSPLSTPGSPRMVTNQPHKQIFEMMFWKVLSNLLTPSLLRFQTFYAHEVDEVYLHINESLYRVTG